jgi:fumarylpyruvate hydrolase
MSIEAPTQPAFAVPPPPLVLAPVLGTDALFPVRRIFCVGRNYADHAKEMGFTGREPPFFFMKPAEAAVCVLPERTGRIAYPGLTADLHHEVELVVALGRGGSNIPASAALDHVFGYAAGLDMTRRDLQNDMKKQGRPWEIGKAFDQSAPLGSITPAPQAGDIATAAIVLRVNGEVRQRGKIDQMIWSVAEIIEELSKAWTLQAGDLIYTGTPEGVAAVVQGDTLKVEITGLAPLAVQVD